MRGGLVSLLHMAERSTVACAIDSVQHRAVGLQTWDHPSRSRRECEMRLSVGLLLILAVAPFTLAAVLWRAVTLERQLVIWFSAGIVLSQWMHAMLSVWQRHLSGERGSAELNVLYLWHVPWWIALIAGIGIGLVGGRILDSWCLEQGDFHLRRLAVTLFLLLIMSQLAGSSVPKFAGEVCLAIILVTGLLVNRYFLSYPPGPLPPASQVQGDALTSLGLVVTVVAVLWPSFTQFGTFLFEKYFDPSSNMRQFQMTRYAAYGAWLLVGFAIIGWKNIDLLVKARSGRLP